MPRTIYRQPNIVDTDIDTNIKFHSHSNWKGICDDKNYLNVDQETFEDCKNVYMSSDALLKSRPSFKNKNENIRIKKWIYDEVSFEIVGDEGLMQTSPTPLLYIMVWPVIFKKDGLIWAIDERNIRYYDKTLQKLGLTFLKYPVK
jgi:hypothetical protein